MNLFQCKANIKNFGFNNLYQVIKTEMFNFGFTSK